MKIHIHSLTVGGTYREAEISQLHKILFTQNSTAQIYVSDTHL